MPKKEQPKKWVISHFPHSTGWRYSWIETKEDGSTERFESETFSKPGEARQAAKHKQKEFDVEQENQ